MKRNNREEIKYYYIDCLEVMGKEENGEYFIYENGEWVPDAKYLIKDRLIGYDPSEPAGSPYGIGNTEIMNEIKDVTEIFTEFLEDERIVSELCEKWEIDFKEAKKEWDKNPLWPAKLVEVAFNLHNNEFVITPECIGLTDSNWDHGFMETVQEDMIKDLEEIGATNITISGFMD